MIKECPNTPKLPPSITLLINSIVYTLQDYQNLPLHLAITYLMFAQNDSFIRLDEFKLKRYVFDTRFGLDLNQITWNDFSIGFGEVEVNGQIKANVLTELVQYVKELDLKTKCFFTHPPFNAKNIENYVYSRNKDLINPLNKVVEYFDKKYKDIPYFLAYSYLELNRDKALKTVSLYKNESGYIRYDKQNQTLKWKKNGSSGRFEITHPAEVLEMYNRPQAGGWSDYKFVLPEEFERKFWDYKWEEIMRIDPTETGIKDEQLGKPKAIFSGRGMVLKF
jgi:hypothetical protein